MATTRETGLLTVAAIRTGKNESPQYLFYERERIFVLSAMTIAAFTCGAGIRGAGAGSTSWPIRRGRRKY